MLGTQSKLGDVVLRANPHWEEVDGWVKHRTFTRETTVTPMCVKQKSQQLLI